LGIDLSGQIKIVIEIQGEQDKLVLMKKFMYFGNLKNKVYNYVV